MGLHAKAIVIDGKRVFIGSMNLDPRSWRLNSEMGVVVESESLGAEVLAAVERDLRRRQARIGIVLQLHQVAADPGQRRQRSEEHTSELQSLMRISYAVFCLKKKTYT